MDKVFIKRGQRAKFLGTKDDRAFALHCLPIGLEMVCMNDWNEGNGDGLPRFSFPEQSNNTVANHFELTEIELIKE